MKISLIVAAYNAETTIRKCLDSLINQTYKNIEIIVINDGSKDSTEKICEEYKAKDDRIVLINQQNHGVSYSRNRGISLATGDYVTFVDSDDYIDLNTIEVLVENLSSDMDFIRYNFIASDNKSKNDLYELKDKEVSIQENLDNLLRHFLAYKNSIPNYTPLLLIKNSVVKNLEFNENLSMLEDADFYNMLFLNSNKAKFIDKKMYHYYINPNSVTRSNLYYTKNISSVLKANNIIIRRCEKLISNELKKEINATHLNVISNFLIKIYRSSRKEYDDELLRLKSDENFKRMIKESSLGAISIKNSILLYFIKHRLNILSKVYLFMLKSLYKILGK